MFLLVKDSCSKGWVGRYGISILICRQSRKINLIDKELGKGSNSTSGWLQIFFIFTSTWGNDPK